MDSRRQPHRGVIREGIYVVEADGSRVTKVYAPAKQFHEVGSIEELRDAHSPSVSPNEDRVVYNRRFDTGRLSHYELISANLDGSDEQQLADNIAAYIGPSWSPDGTHLAFFAQPTGGGHLVTMAPDGSDMESLAAIYGDYGIWPYTSPVWSPDGQYLAFVGSPRKRTETQSRWALYTIRSDGSDLRKISPTWSQGAWSPDGTRIAFVRREDNSKALFEAKADGSDMREIARWEDSYDSEGARGVLYWSPDGSEIRIGGFPLTIVKADGSEVRRLLMPGQHIPALFAVAWSPDGSRAVVGFKRFPHIDEGVVLFTTDPEGSDNRVLVRETKDRLLIPSMGEAWDPAPVLRWEVLPRDSENTEEPKDSGTLPDTIPMLPASATIARNMPPCAGETSSGDPCEPRDRGKARLPTLLTPHPVTYPFFRSRADAFLSRASGWP